MKSVAVPELLQKMNVDLMLIVQTVENELSRLDNKTLNRKPSAESWSAAECLEHLNRYSRFYNPELAKKQEKLLDKPKIIKTFSSNWLGKKFIEMMRKTNKKHKTLKHMNPTGSTLDAAEVVREFLGHQKQLSEIIHRSEGIDWQASVIPVEFFKLLKMSFGDAILFVIEHEKRHLAQALRALK
jgi:uncharacterized damage-inducible protein DinB